MKLLEQDPSPSDPNPLNNGFDSQRLSAHQPTNGFSNGFTNGHSHTKQAHQQGQPVASTSSNITRVSLPGTSIPGAPQIQREEFIRLIIQSLRDAGYIESAATLEAESGFVMESPSVAAFREHILGGRWTEAHATLKDMNVDKENLSGAALLISIQKYMETLELGGTHITVALRILRNEIAPEMTSPPQAIIHGVPGEVDTRRERLHELSSYLMCSSAEDLRLQSGWDGKDGNSRRRLLVDLQKYIPSALLLPAYRLPNLLTQALAYQASTCHYHNEPTDPPPTYSLYSEHSCTRSTFPTTTTYILAEHTDEVWHICWSNSGRYLASGGKDKSTIIWKVGPSTTAPDRQIVVDQILRDGRYEVSCMVWSPDDKMIVTATEEILKIWNVKTGEVICEIADAHTETVMGLQWLPDGSGFISGAMDRKVIIWNADGSKRDTIGPTPIRISHLAVTPDMTRLIVVGLIREQPSTPTPAAAAGTQTQPEPKSSSQGQVDHRMVIYSLADKHEVGTLRFQGDLSSVQISKDSRFALVNHVPSNPDYLPAEVQLWDLQTLRMVRRYAGQRQNKNIIRGAFGGMQESFVLTGSDDGQIFVWHRDSGVLLEILKGHARGSVSCVAWHPKEARLFASCSDDHTIRVWEPPPMEEGEEMLDTIEESEAVHVPPPVPSTPLSPLGEKARSPRLAPSHSPASPPPLPPTTLRNDLIPTPSPTGSEELVITVTV